MQRRPRRQPRRVHRLGPGRAQRGLERSRSSSRSGAARWSPPATSSFYGTMDGWFKAVDARTGELLWQFKTRLRDHRPADHLPRARTASSTSRCSPASAAGPAPSSPATSTRATRTAALGFVNAMKRPAAAHRAGRHALCLRAGRRPPECTGARRSRSPARDRRAGWRALRAAGARRRALGRPATLLRVCADPNNLPFSNERGEGFENRLAELLAARPRRARARTPGGPQRRGFVRNTLSAGACDVVIGRAGELRAGRRRRGRTTARRYVFVSPAGPALGVRVASTTRAARLRIGVQLIGDDFANPPPAHALSRARASSATSSATRVYGDYARAESAGAHRRCGRRGDVDVAVVWGPLAGYFAAPSEVPLRHRRRSRPQVDRRRCRSRSTSRWACAGRHARSGRARRRSRRDAAPTSTRSWTGTACRVCRRAEPQAGGP